MRARSLLVVWLACVGVTLQIAKATPASGQAVQSRASQDGMSEARALFLAGRVAFEEERYETALKYFEASHEQSHRPQLLYNIGQCQERLKRLPEAVQAFESYLAADPHASNRGEVEAHVVELRTYLASTDRVSPAVQGPAPAQLSPAASSVEARSPAGAPAVRPVGAMITAGAGVVLALGGAALMMTGKAHGRDIADTQIGASRAQVEDDLHAAERQWLSGQVLLGVGLVALATGATWYTVQRRRQAIPMRVAVALFSVRIAGDF